MHKVMILHKFKLSTNCIVSKQTACLTKVQIGQQNVKATKPKISKDIKTSTSTKGYPKAVKESRKYGKRDKSYAEESSYCKHIQKISSFSRPLLFQKIVHKQYNNA